MISNNQIHDICWKAMSKGAIALYPDELQRLTIHVIRTSRIPEHRHLSNGKRQLIASKVAALSIQKSSHNLQMRGDGTA